ncbi:hypothetical protein DFJ63DRAFT_336794 [Scheffersomyces coipomensis]|uniref:uncharacterized protein n=1 Tax=Scheffersomyces coipomensis TaxID=1788519 RepID=UPI00315DB2DF
MIDITHFIILIVTIISPLIDATFHQSSAIPTRKRETFFYFFAKRDPCASICQEAGFQVFNACAAWDSNDWSTASCLCEIDDETLYDEFFECDECENDTNQDTIQGLRDYQCELANSLYSTYVPYSTPPFSGYLTRTYSFENQIFYYTYNGTNIFTTNSDGQTILQTLTQTNGSSSTNTVSYQVTDLNNNTETYASSFSLTSLPSYASTQGTVVDSGQPIQIASSTLSPSSSSIQVLHQHQLHQLRQQPTQAMKLQPLLCSSSLLHLTKS